MERLRPVLSPDDLIAATFAFHVPYREALAGPNGLPASRVEREMLAHDHPALQLSGIYVHSTTGGITAFTHGINRLMRYRSLAVSVPGNDFRWKSPLPPREYYAKFIKEKVNQRMREHIDDFVATLPR